MARIRSIHPGIYTDEAWASVSIPARWLAKGICTEADDNGVFEWKPLQLKMRIFPADAVDMVAMLSELEGAGIVMRFEGEGRALGALKNFCKYQRPRKPKAWFPITDHVRQFVALGCDDPVLTDDEAAPVPQKSVLTPVEVKPVPTKSEKSPQMEDGGGKREKKEGEANASLSPLATKRPYPESFEAAWKAYPHTKGRSSKPESLKLWLKLPADEQSSLAGAASAFAAKLSTVCGDKGAPDMAVWLRQGKHADWLEAAANVVPLMSFSGPPEVRQAVVSAKGEPFARSYVDPCQWDDTGRRLIARNGIAFKALQSEVGAVLAARHVSIERAA
jgi:hypothetical protein